MGLCPYERFQPSLSRAFRGSSKRYKTAEAFEPLPFERDWLKWRSRSRREDDTLRVEVDLPLEPGLARLHHVRTVLLGGVQISFLRVMPRRRKTRDGLAPDEVAPP
jgi:hypothetical protein